MTEAELEYHRAWRAANREKVLEAAARWRGANPGWWRKYSATDKRREQQRVYHERNRDRRRIAVRARYRANPAPFIEHARRHQMRRAGATTEHVEYAAIIERDRNRCGICGEVVAPADRSFDHIVPLKRGGAHSMANVQLAHFVCNCRKGAR